MAMEAKNRMVQEAKILSKLGLVVEEFRKLDETIQANAIITFLLVAQKGKEGINMREMQEILGIARSSMSRNVAILSDYQNKKGFGLLIAQEDPFDRKSKKVFLTQKGSALAKRVLNLLAI